jgi:hypothetical protein
VIKVNIANSFIDNTAELEILRWFRTYVLSPYHEEMLTARLPQLHGHILAPLILSPFVHYNPTVSNHYIAAASPTPTVNQRHSDSDGRQTRGRVKARQQSTFWWQKLKTTVPNLNRFTWKKICKFCGCTLLSSESHGWCCNNGKLCRPMLP